MSVSVATSHFIGFEIFNMPSHFSDDFNTPASCFLYLLLVFFISVYSGQLFVGYLYFIFKCFKSFFFSSGETNLPKVNIDELKVSGLSSKGDDSLGNTLTYTHISTLTLEGT